MSQALQVINNDTELRTVLETQQKSLMNMVPPGIDKQRLIAAAWNAFNFSPNLKGVEYNSFLLAITQSAKAGILPDKKEGVIVAFKNNKKGGIKEAVFIPMVYGLRRRARETDRIIIQASVVRFGDHFRWVQGDAPLIEHEATAEGLNGELVAAYAIIRDDTDRILHREVMYKVEIEQVRSKSKEPDGMLWKEFTPEAWRKTVVRRAIKSVPTSETLASIVQLDDQQYDFEEQQRRKSTVNRVEAPADGQQTSLPPRAGQAVEQAEGTAGEAEGEVQVHSGDEEVQPEKCGACEGTGKVKGDPCELCEGTGEL